MRAKNVKNKVLYIHKFVLRKGPDFPNVDTGLLKNGCHSVLMLYHLNRNKT